MQPAGQDPEAHLVPGAVTLPLRLQTNASPFWIMLLLVWGRLDNGMILFGWPNELAKIPAYHARPRSLSWIFNRPHIQRGAIVVLGHGLWSPSRPSSISWT